MGLSVKGTVACRFDEQEICCYLTYTPDSNVETTMDQVVELLHANRITVSTPSAVNKVMGEFQAKKETFETIFAAGVPPEPPEAEHVAWNDCVIPEYVKPHIADVLKNAPLPKVFKKKKESVEVASGEADDKKSGRLFNKKKETVTTRIVESLVPVTVDPQVQETKYFKRDELCGSLVPPKPGKPGKSVRGQVVPPPTLKDPSFYLGTGLYKVKDALYASVSGILRIGTNWADIVPFSQGSYAIAYDSATNGLALTYETGDQRFEKPSPTKILEEAAEKIVAGQTLINSNEFLARFKAAQANSDGMFSVQLCESHDSAISVTIAADKTTSYLTLQKAVGDGVPLELRNVSAAINQYRFKGLSLEAIKKDIREFFTGETVTLENYVLSTGIMPERGENRSVVLKTIAVDDAEKKELIDRIEKNADANIQLAFPIAEADSLSVVKAHQHVAGFSAAKTGKSGVDVFGNPIQGLPGNDPVIQVTGALEISSNGLYTESDGLLAIKQTEESFFASLIPYKDSTITVTVADDELSAWAYMTRSVGAGVPLSLALVKTTLEKFNVTYGISDEDVSKRIEEINKTGIAGKYCVAHGQQPAAAGSLVITWFVPPNESKSGTGVKKGVAIASLRRIDSDTPQKGFTVHGKEIDSQFETAIMELPHDESITEQKEDNGTVTLIAQTNGIVFYSNGVVSIKNERVIESDIDEHVGNIKFNGSLDIGGGVRKGHVILADGDISVKRLVEESLISSNGSVSLYDGIMGNGKGIVRARDTIKTRFAERSRLYAGQDIFVQNHCFDCQIKTNTMLHIDTDGAALTGGVALTSKGIVAYDIGSPHNVHTEISFGQNYLIADQIDVTEKEVDKIKLQLTGIDRELKKLAQMPPAMAAEKTKKLRMMKVTAMKILQQKFLRLFTLREKFELHIPSSIIVKHTIYPGVIMESHGRYLEITKPRNGVIFTFDVRSGRILEQQIEKNDENTEKNEEE